MGIVKASYTDSFSCIVLHEMLRDGSIFKSPLSKIDQRDLCFQLASFSPMFSTLFEKKGLKNLAIKIARRVKSE